MTEVLIPKADSAAIVIRPLDRAQWTAFAAAAPARHRAAAMVQRFEGAAGDLALLADSEGGLEAVLFGLGDAAGARAMSFRGLPVRLPAGDYRIDASPGDLDPELVALAWVLGAYRFDRYKLEKARPAPRLVGAAGVDGERVAALARACALARDMINTPANDMGPGEVEAIARDVAKARGAEILVARGEDLSGAGYPLVHAVGRAATVERAPRFIEMTWGEPTCPLLALVGKGVVFDSGGLDIKPSAGMRWMKKDMGGAAHVLALADLVMGAVLPVRLQVLLPVVENAIAGDAMRPGDIIRARNGLSVEIGNTDAEGRLILADALCRASELAPDLTLDMATLTGAARVALGPEVTPFYTNDEALAGALTAAAATVEDPLWRMPLWPGYAAGLESDVADLKNDPDAWVQAGSVAAGLFLKRFAPAGAWAHFDIFAWNPRARPGWPQGGEVQALRAIFAMLQARYTP
jgi:leucyl aminopeptidase